MAARGDFRGGQAIMKTYKQKMRANISNEAQVAQYNVFNANLAECYGQINQVQ
jgi:hypothetical protein